MNTEEKILTLLEQMNTRMESLESGQAAFEGRMGRLETTLTELQGTQAKMLGDLTSVKLRLELDIEKRFDAVNEGVDSILEKLTPKSRVDELEADVVVLKSAIKMLSQEVAELKKVQ